MPQRILVVDDERDIVFVLKMALEKEGYAVEEAYDGFEALQKIGAQVPDLMLLDIMMPKLDGYSVNMKLKENPATANLPVIIISGKGHLQELLKIRDELQVAAYLEKPFAVAALLDKVREILGQKN